MPDTVGQRAHRNQQARHQQWIDVDDPQHLGARGFAPRSRTDGDMQDRQIQNDGKKRQHDDQQHDPSVGLWG
ncbi:hypothetical protein J4732_08015 [Serratia marcescens]|uniref:Uncharacterized protein n=1 Tax=Serratia marcescens TaxID=615 RepID=A0A939STE8_SERMA|nr:hypothetical protein [Serratia marcescens]